MVFVLPPKASVGYLDPEIAGEGQKIILSDGDQVSWNPPPPKPVMPDWSEIKSIRRYFGRTGYQVYPAWLYHPTEDARLVKNADEAAELGVCYREATDEEKGRYGRNAVWDWKDDSKWRPNPAAGSVKFDPLKPGPGKTFLQAPQTQSMVQHDLIVAVAAAVTKSLTAGGIAAPAHVDPKDWDAFLQFKAWQQSQSAVEAVSQPAAETGGQGTNPLTSMASESADWDSWAAEAERKGIKVDKRWSVARLKSEVEKAA